MAAALVAIPWLIRGLGTDRYGVLLLAWAIVGYFGFVDFGLGRALTHAVASRLGGDAESELDRMVWTALFLLLVLGMTGGVALAAGAPWIVLHLREVGKSLRSETLASIYWLALSLPLTVVTAGLRGVIEAHGHFGASTALRLPLAVFSYVAPLAVLPFTRRLDIVVAVLVLGRFITAAAHFVLCVRRYWFLRRRMTFSWPAVSPLLHIGGWMTASNVVSPLMTYVDRFFISALLPMAAVAYYATPYEAVTKLLVFPTAVVGVLFPEFAAAAVNDRPRASAMLEDGIRAIVLCLFPAVFILAVLPHEILSLWVRDAAVAREGAMVLRWLAIGVLANSIGYVPFVALQGAGRADLTGKLNLLELPAYAMLLWYLTRHFGIAGAAAAWTLRVALDALVLVVMARRTLGDAPHEGGLVTMLAIMSALLGGSFMNVSTLPRVALVLLVGVVYLPIAWKWLLRQRERDAILALLPLSTRAECSPP